MQNGEIYTLPSDGYSYILLKSEKKNSIHYLKPFISPLLLKSNKKVTYYIIKCRPTYVGYLQQQQIVLKSLKPNDVLRQLSSAKFKAITPTLLDNLIIELLYKSKAITLTEFKKKYQCKNNNLELLLKKTIGLTFLQYQSLLLNST
ncbi:hypothetical protein [Winogradskyella wichelsiae]|uniref:hypothetical protein n=1 Tax=Winogradskyella wichelsiae TaxID=2697007 RepID=UPI003EF0B8E9